MDTDLENSLLFSGCSEYQDIVFSVDRSFSINQVALGNVFTAMRNVIDDLNKDDGTGGQKEKVRVGVQIFNTQQEVLKHLNDFGGTINVTPAVNGGTDIIGALA